MSNPSLRTLVSAAVLALASASFAVPVAAFAQTVIIAPHAPPPVRVETVPPPRPGFVWDPGHWHWAHGDYVWRPGHWQPVRTGYHWVPGHWIAHGPNWRWVPGHWA
ncbi:YXWGXW repeat-containing protein [Paraburkholderia tropica]|uniref:YXWGXW repeat-containing protein n=1 Tax=Paraburkholderia tropica TaxID=92647 RepID=UPI002ABD7B74|nr:YXWGXW repeat-containing protein [Paraburkholderia tropica]